MKFFNWGGVKCPRCDEKNDKAADYCVKCGVGIGAGVSAAVIRDNRWQPAENELAVFFGVSALKGLFTKKVVIPPSTQALIFQNGKSASVVSAGEYELEGFFSRINNLLRDQPAEILITRTAALPFDVSFDAIPTAEHLPVTAKLRLAVAVSDDNVFHARFMAHPGAVTTADVAALVSDSLRALLVRFLGARSIDEWSTNGSALTSALRDDLSAEINAVAYRRGLGLAFKDVEIVSLGHEGVNRLNEKRGTFWLARKEAMLNAEQGQALDQLYDAVTLRKLARKAAALEHDRKGGALESDDQFARDEAKVSDAERRVALLARQLAVSRAISKANSEAELEALHAEEEVKQYREKLVEDKLASTEHDARLADIKKLAAIDYETQLGLAQLRQKSAIETERLQIEATLQRRQIDVEIQQARLIEDEEERRAAMQRAGELKRMAEDRAVELEDLAQKGKMLDFAIEADAKQRAAQRVHAWADYEVKARMDVDSIRVDGARSAANIENLKGLLEVRRIKDRDQFEAEQRKANVDWSRQLQKYEVEYQANRTQFEANMRERELEHKHQLDLAQKDIERIVVVGAMSDTSKIAVAPIENARVLADVVRGQQHSGMTAQQILASIASHAPHAVEALKALATNETQPASILAGGHVPPPAGVSFAELLAYMKAVDDERKRDESERRREDREHELKVKSIEQQNQANLLNAMGQMGVGIAGAGARPASPAAPAFPPIAATPPAIHVYPSPPAAAPFAAAGVTSSGAGLPHKVCSHCRTANDASAVFCSGCGAKF